MRALDRRARLGAALLALGVLVAVVGPWLLPDPTAFVGLPLEPPSAAHWLGTTGQGQDVLAQTVAGARATLAVAAAVGLCTVALGAGIGAVAGFLGGAADAAIGLIVNVALVLPGLPLMVVLAAWLPPGPVTMAAVLCLTGWPWHARVFRSVVVGLAQRDFVTAAVMRGEPTWRVVVVELLPNLSSLLAASAVGATTYAVGAQVGLEFLGLGDLSAVTWGTNLYWATNDSALLVGAWWTFVPTGVCVALVGFALALLGAALDEVNNPRLAVPGAAGPQPTPVRTAGGAGG